MRELTVSATGVVKIENGKRIEHPQPCELCAKIIRNAQIRRVES